MGNQMGLATVVALVSDFETAAQVVPELGRLGIARPDIHVTSGDLRGIRDFSEQLGISEVNLLDKSDPASHAFHERLPVSRAAYFKEQLHGKRVLFVVADVRAGAEITGVFQRLGADFGPDVSELDNREVRVPLRAERLNIEKYLVQSGSVRLRKEITTEVERFEVTLVREEFVIERTPLSGQAKTETIRIPLRHEEVNVTRRTIVTNEVSVRREQHVEIRQMEQPVRYEELWLTKQGEVIVHEAPST